MIEDGAVRPEGCICELHSDISPDLRNILTIFGYNMLYAIYFFAITFIYFNIYY